MADIVAKIERQVSSNPLKNSGGIREISETTPNVVQRLAYRDGKILNRLQPIQTMIGSHVAGLCINPG